MTSAFLRAKAIGVMHMLDQGERDDKIICVCADDPEYRHYNDISELPEHRLREIRRFFEDYKKNENKDVAVDEFYGAEAATKVIKESMCVGEKGLPVFLWPPSLCTHPPMHAPNVALLDNASRTHHAQYELPPTHAHTPCLLHARRDRYGAYILKNLN